MRPLRRIRTAALALVVTVGLVACASAHSATPGDGSPLEGLFKAEAARCTGATVAGSALDHAVRGRSEHWGLERMAAVDRNVIRLALYELLHHPETPPKVVINEALEMARRFSGEGSVEFVNGVLDGIRKTLPAPP